MNNVIRLRKVQDQDSDRIFLWRNDPYIVARSSSRREVTMEEHEAWFHRSVRDERQLLFIAEAHGEAMGLIRFERESDLEAIISAYLLERFTGKGLGPLFILEGCRLAFLHWTIEKVTAFVREDNASGQSGFSKAGFALDESAGDCPARHVIFSIFRDRNTSQLMDAYNTHTVVTPAFRRDCEQQISFYEGLLAQHGISHRSLNWGTVVSQQRRFRALADLADLNGTSVLDVGCGLGDFWVWLSSRQVPVDYTGIDLTPAMVEKARERLPARRFIVATPESMPDVELFDYVVASGIFYLQTIEPEQYFRSTITQMFALARRGIAFNSLSTWAAQVDAGEFYADPLRTVEFCRTLSPWVVLRHDYLPHDFTVYIYKEQPVV